MLPCGFHNPYYLKKKTYSEMENIAPVQTARKYISQNLSKSLSKFTLIMLSTLQPSMSHNLPHTTFSDASRNY